MINRDSTLVSTRLIRAARDNCCEYRTQRSEFLWGRLTSVPWFLPLSVDCHAGEKLDNSGDFTGPLNNTDSGCEYRRPFGFADCQPRFWASYQRPLIRSQRTGFTDQGQSL